MNDRIFDARFWDIIESIKFGDMEQLVKMTASLCHDVATDQYEDMIQRKEHIDMLTDFCLETQMRLTRMLSCRGKA